MIRVNDLLAVFHWRVILAWTRVTRLFQTRGGINEGTQIYH
jgi:hypothetical protein